MDIRTAKIVPDTRVYELKQISKEAGRKRLTELKEAGDIAPLVTGTKRTLLSFEEAERLAASL